MFNWFKAANYNVIMILPKKKTSCGLSIPRRPPLQAIFINTNDPDVNDGNGEILNQVLLDAKLVDSDPAFVDLDGCRPWDSMIKKAETVARLQQREAEARAKEEAFNKKREEALKSLVENWLAST